MKKSAVKWLIDKLFQLDNLTPNQLEILEQAKEMEKQQQDDFAIGFAHFLAEHTYSSYESGWSNDFGKKELTTKELLEIYKKEKGL